MKSRGETRVREFSEFVAARRPHLRRLAYALCHDWHTADDLVQTALEKAYLAWPKLRRAGAEEAFVRTILVRSNVDRTRRSWRRENPTEELPDQGYLDACGPDDDLVEALGRLPQMQRKVVLMRFWLDLPVAQCAEELGVSEGTVKSHASRGVAALREQLVPQECSG